MTAIQWTDETWNPTRGCSVVSPGCVNCYAMKQAHRFSAKGKPYNGLTKQTKAGPQWTGTVLLDEPTLLKPLSWKRPRRVFVNSMSDLFHDALPDDYIDSVFAVMALCPQHTFQVLTKRPARMRAYLAAGQFRDVHVAAAAKALHTMPQPFALPDERIFDARRVARGEPWLIHAWPLPNVWLGVSVENQQYADERIPLLLQTPAAVRFISAEPLLGPVNLGAYLEGYEDHGTPFSGARTVGGCIGWTPPLDWVIVGGESGPGARPFDIAWPRLILQQCQAAGVACFVKQLGANPVASGIGPVAKMAGWTDRKGGDPAEWPADLRVREWPV
jgi:protein gp37